MPVKVGDPADPRALRPSREHRRAHGVVGVSRRDGPVFEHGLAEVSRKELKAEVWIG